MQKPTHINRKPLYAAVVGGVFAISASSLVIADAVNPAAAQNPLMLAASDSPCNPCAAKNPCTYGIDHGYKTARKEDCEAINDKTGEQRLTAAKTLRLKPGKYTFRVSNKNVPYVLGFYLRGAGVFNYATLPRVSGGGLTIGTSRDYTIELKPGSYVYSCPLNPTPDYRLEVSAG